ATHYDSRQRPHDPGPSCPAAAAIRPLSLLSALDPKAGQVQHPAQSAASHIHVGTISSGEVPNLHRLSAAQRLSVGQDPAEALHERLGEESQFKRYQAGERQHCSEE
ncbi:hypothetical protein Vafri_20036, partial [Volvox africanus]